LENVTFLGSHVVGKRFDKKYDRALSILDESQRLIQLCLLSDQQTIVSAVEQYLRVMIEDIQGLQSNLIENGKRIASLEDSVPRRSKELKTDAEQMTKKLTRLEQEQYLAGLPYAEGAALDSNLRQIPSCLPHTRLNILAKIQDWNQDAGEKPIFWLNGMAGIGKSTIASSVASRLRDSGSLAASFPFSRGGGDLAKATKLLLQ
jgi:septal ring factor EnvC (AmiA/AmiB activator)